MSTAFWWVQASLDYAGVGLVFRAVMGSWARVPILDRGVLRPDATQHQGPRLSLPAG